MNDLSEEDQREWELISYVISSSMRLRVLIKLDKGVYTPKQLSEALNVQISRISTVLKELRERRLVKCLTPQQRKGKLYTITKDGRKIIYIIHNKTKIKGEL